MENLVSLLKRNAAKYPQDLGVYWPKGDLYFTWPGRRLSKEVIN
ncbi:hypothetical protein [Carboxydothermus pertinax]|uniref:Uncharacterized protein n=1 Tax=Carboxydothermus pertinax TaxID=870242 RepID=A0A1L8CUX1_9THEO|nr:hypothetical protein [Carboxydothermus pertinax]GAV22710.1 hypothetical protein cpu_12200 [Carboxydothermus pertinax]